MNLRFGHTAIHLTDELAYKWTVTDTVCVRGYAFVDDVLLQAESLASYFTEVDSAEDAIHRVARLSGIYNIIIVLQDGVFACVDQTRSMPLFYRKQGVMLELYDSLDDSVIQDFSIDEDMLRVYKCGLNTLGDKTVFQAVYQIQARHCLIANEDSVLQKEYLSFSYPEKQIQDVDVAAEATHQFFLTTFRRLIRVLNGRTAVIPLSGGHDSRLIAFYLKHLGYSNIVAYTYGIPNNPEVLCSKQVAKALDIPWHFVPHKPANMRRLFHEEYAKFAIMAGNGVSVPCLQEWYAVYRLKKQGIITEDSVIVPGYGAIHLLAKNNKSEVTYADLVKNILTEHFESIEIQTPEQKEFLISCIEKELSNYCSQAQTYTDTQAQQIMECFNRNTRQSLFISNAVRVYDYFSCQWAVPFFEWENFCHWSQIDNELRRGKKALNAMQETVFPAALNAVPFAPSIARSRLKKRLNVLRFGPQAVHFMYGYYKLGFRFFYDLKKRRLRSVNAYARDAYIALVTKLSR